MKNILLAVLLFAVKISLAQNGKEVKMDEFHPVSIYKVPVSQVNKAKYPLYDMHTHDYPKNDQEVDEWVKTMDECGVAKSMILTYTTGKSFDSLYEKYARYKDRFMVFCGFDYTGYDKPGWEKHAVAELERCYRKGARGVGELGDKGLGEFYSKPTPGYGLHIDDPRMKPLLQKCAELKMPISIHVAEDAWMYLPADSTNDGLMNAGQWHVDMTVKGKLGHDELVQSLENAVRDNPKTTFVACHLANTCSDLSRIAGMFDKYPNLYADIAARYAELAPIPKYVHAFLEKYNDRIVYGTDMGTSASMYRITFRILESEDEHFYDPHFDYHWALYGLGLSDETLKKIYSTNAQKILNK